MAILVCYLEASSKAVHQPNVFRAVFRFVAELSDYEKIY